VDADGGTATFASACIWERWANEHPLLLGCSILQVCLCDLAFLVR
jgi:hypothetical protein